MSGRRALTMAVMACVVGSLLALGAATRTWAVHPQPASPPLMGQHILRRGTDELPWLSALALVALAGAGALLATRGGMRAVVGVIVLAAGLGLAAGGVDGLTRVAGVSPFWPLLCVPAGLLVAAAGAYAVARGRAWPAMGLRYERRRPAPVSPAEDQVQRIGPSPSDVAMWDALDRGEDPSR